MSNFTRRGAMLAAGAAGVLNATPSFAQQDELVVEDQQGDPTLAVEQLQFSPSRITRLTSPNVAASLVPRIPNFSSVFLSTAQEFLGKNRVNAEADITGMLNTFGVGFRWGEPPRLTAFCAAGAAYVAAMAYARSQNEDLTTDRIRKIRKYLIEVGQYHFYPTVSVIDMWKVADGTRRMRARDQHANVRPGWLIVYNWSGSDDYNVANHVGIVERYDPAEGVYHTIEFNTCLENESGGSQGNGGEITRRNRRHGNTVKGFINTSVNNPF